MEVTLKIRAEREEDFAVLRAIMDVLERNKEPQAGAQSMAGQPWTEEAFLTFWESIGEQARGAMREMAKRPDGYPADALLVKLDFTGADLAKCMSSIGHHIERIDSYNRFQRPVVRDWEGKIYMMPNDVAQTIRRLEL